MNNYIKVMNKSIKKLIFNALKISIFKPRMLIFLYRVILSQKRAIKKRLENESIGIHIPPFLIASITNKCNLRCKGCYAQAFDLKTKNELKTERWDAIFQEAQDLGISFILLAGGEPLIREDIIIAASKYQDILFPVFTNATLINPNAISHFKKMMNILPIISIEGYNSHTDDRRGAGISDLTLNAMDSLRRNNIFYGLSLTLNCENFDIIINENFIKEHIKKGAHLFFFVEYVPITENSDYLVITQEQRIKLTHKLIHFRKKFKSLFIAFPQDEKKFGGCLSSGRGFMHISAKGDLEPCPFAPYSDTNLQNLPLKEALKSQFLKNIRESDEHLSETETGCALFNKKDWVKSILNNNQ